MEFNSSANKLKICAAVAYSLKSQVESLHDDWVSEVQKTDKAAELYSEGRLSYGHLMAAIKYRDYLWQLKAFFEKMESTDVEYLAGSDYVFNLPDDTSTEE